MWWFSYVKVFCHIQFQYAPQIWNTHTQTHMHKNIILWYRKLAAKHVCIHLTLCPKENWKVMHGKILSGEIYENLQIT